VAANFRHGVASMTANSESPIALVSSFNAAGVVATTDFAVACQGVSVAVMCGGVQRRGLGLAQGQLMFMAAANCRLCVLSVTANIKVI
jgi:hypothetical protein